MSSDSLVHRPTARIIVVDDRDRILLFSALDQRNHPELGRFWFTPGGGLHDGETFSEGASRELREETGLQVSPERLGPVVAESSGIWTTQRGQRFYSEVSFFCVRVPRFEIDTSGFEQIERDEITGHRWWSHAELRATPEIVLPRGLADLVRRLLSGQEMRSPVWLPWGGRSVPDDAN
jgi:8-oxo-dGTP pyrophosphatase MutT (NUDIX family)